MNQDYILIQATLADLEELLNFAKSTFIDTYEHLNNPKSFQDYLDKAFSKENFKAEIETPNTHFYVLREEETIIGYIKLNFSKGAEELDSKICVEIERIYVLPKAKGKGYGKALIEKAKKVAIEQGKQVLWLGVWEHNAKAIGFYEKMGFKKFGTHIFMMGNEVQNDYLMKMDLLEQNI